MLSSPAGRPQGTKTIQPAEKSRRHAPRRRRSIDAMFMVIDTEACRTIEDELRLWRQLWQLRDVARLNVALPTVVSSPCPLLAEEPADTMLACGIQVPRNSAWISLHVDLTDFAEANGELCMPALQTALDDCVDRGDILHDLRRWPIPDMHYDSWLNRRLSVLIRGWGNLVKKRGADPSALQTLNELGSLAAFIGNTMRRRSRALARKKGHCPAVDAAGASILASSGEMKIRWRRAVDSTALRHRNLVAMSVWDLFPQDEPADFRYADLLPLLRCANSLSFRRSVDISHWNVDHYRRFHNRVSAILRYTVANGCVAKQV